MEKLIPSFADLLKLRLKGKSFLYEIYFKGKKTLDVGCGEGHFLAHDKSLMHGVDTNKRVIDRLGKSGFNVKLASGDTLPYMNSEFEAVNCHNVIEHLDVEKAYGLIKESARVLKSGGLFILSSEVVTKKFWNTFGHVKPYPPEAVLKLMREESREEFESINDLEYVGAFYLGNYFKNRVAYLISAFLGFYTTILRREYYLVLRKK